MEKLNYSELLEKLLNGERVLNPIVGFKKYDGDSVPQYLHSIQFISPYLKEKSGGKGICYDFDSEEMWLK